MGAYFLGHPTREHWAGPW